ncbi:hypothetical protein DID88_001927 [Monilinia fructigena]|uniref:Short-chain dehydrogenase/reductase SDR n=1 Tax=Monilinia fructigena TaxID=38457 RepID=A0A395IWD2_9HELO|nr:hypothetical protein DID88_001927 [Monilinia fructigena]
MPPSGLAILIGAGPNTVLPEFSHIPSMASTLGALRANSEYAAYGATRSSVRQMAQALAREISPLGIHVVHTIANGRIEDKDGEDQRIGKIMSADAVGKTYLWLSEQEPGLWTHGLDMRPAVEKF